MATTRIHHFPIRRWAFGLAGILLLTRCAYGQYDPDWVRHFRAGAMVGFNIKAEFGLNGNLGVSHNRPAGVYDDGYVRTDNTGNAGGVTTYWGYDNASQLSGQTLTFHDTTSFSTTGNSTVSKDGGPFVGFDLAYGGNLWYWKRFRIGWELGFGLLPIRISANQSLSGTVDQSAYTFDTGGIQVPPAPYRGGASGSAAPSIPATATSTNHDTIPGATLTGSQTLDVNLYTFRLGPSLYWDFNQHLGMSLGVGPALGIVSGSLKYNETIDGVLNKGQVSGTDLVFGGYVNATLMWHLVKNGDFYVGAQYMPMGSATISGEGRRGTLKLEGQVYVSAGINWPF